MYGVKNASENWVIVCYSFWLMYNRNSSVKSLSIYCVYEYGSEHNMVSGEQIPTGLEKMLKKVGRYRRVTKLDAQPDVYQINVLIRITTRICF